MVLTSGYFTWTIPLLAKRIRMRISSMMMLSARWVTTVGAASTKTSSTTTATSRTMNSIDITLKFSSVRYATCRPYCIFVSIRSDNQ